MKKEKQVVSVYEYRCRRCNEVFAGTIDNLNCPLIENPFGCSRYRGQSVASPIERRFSAKSKTSDVTVHPDDDRYAGASRVEQTQSLWLCAGIFVIAGEGPDEIVPIALG